jgi:alpha-tubulin suppressor-like RCC1 family protein
VFSTPPPTTPITISAGLYNTCKISAAGALYCWGDNSNGQIDGTFTNATTPTAISGMASGVTDVSVAGNGYTICAVKSGSLYCWGDNAAGQIGDGTTADRLAPTRVSSLINVQRVASAGNHTCALVSSTTIVNELDEYCWGDNTYGQLGLGTNGGTHNSPTLVRSGGVRDIAAHNNHTCDVLNGSIYCWGRNDWGQLGLGNLTDTNARGNPAMPGGVQVASGWNHVCGITSAGVAKCWGANDDGQIGILDCGSYAPCVGGHPYFTTAQTVVGSLRFSSIVAGGSVSCGIVGGNVQCWGYGGAGQMGSGQGSPNCEFTTGGFRGHGGTLNEVCNKSRPSIVASQSPASRVAVGGFHVAVTLLTAPVVVHSWGDDIAGQLGDGGVTRRYSPVATATPSSGW